MRVNWGYWRLWDQTQAIANARSAAVELSRSRVEREEVDMYLARRRSGLRHLGGTGVRQHHP